MCLQILHHGALALCRAQVLAEAHGGDIASQLLVQVGFGDQWPGQARLLHRLEADEQQLKHDLDFFEGDTHALDCERRAEHIQLRSEQFVGQDLFLLDAHGAYDVDSVSSL